MDVFLVRIFLTTTQTLVIQLEYAITVLANSIIFTESIQLKKVRNVFLERDQKKATPLERRFQHLSGHHSDTTIIHSTVTNGIKNNPITKQDITMTLDMLGHSNAAIQGKTMRTQPNAVDNKIIVDLPPTIIKYYGNVELSINVLHVNRIPFLTLMLKKIHVGTINALHNMKIPTMEDYIDKILWL